MPTTLPERQRTREEIQQEEAQEARWQSYEHGAPETGPGEDVIIEPLPTGGNPTPERGNK